jgi:two-component sensor histidine kinase
VTASGGGGEQFSFSLDLPVRNEWRNVELLRTSVENCFQAVFADLDGKTAISMVTGELLENALKYGDWDSEEGRRAFRLRVDGDRARAVVTVQNPVKPGDPGLREVLDTVEWIRTFKTPGDAYRARLLEIAQAEGDTAPSRLGLVRVAYEGNCTVEATVEGATLTVTARMQLG